MQLFQKVPSIVSSQWAILNVGLDGGEELRELVDAVPGQDVGELATEEPALFRSLHVRLDLNAYAFDISGRLDRECPKLATVRNVQGVPSVHGMGWVDWNFECSTVYPILPGLMGIWQKWRGSWARWWNIRINVIPTQVNEQMEHPVLVEQRHQPHSGPSGRNRQWSFSN